VHEPSTVVAVEVDSCTDVLPTLALVSVFSVVPPEPLLPLTQDLTFQRLRRRIDWTANQLRANYL